MHLNSTTLQLYYFILLSVTLGCAPPIEKVVERHNNGVKKKIHVLNSNNEIIEIKSFHFNSVRESVVEIKNNVSHGSYTSWTSTGKLDETGRYAKGVRTGFWQEWYYKNAKRAEGHYIHNRKDGVWRTFYSNGSVRKEIHLSRGDTAGPVLWYYPSGDLEVSNNCHNSDSNRYVSYFQNGSIHVQYDCNTVQKTGRYTEYYAHNQIKVTGHFKNNTKDALWKYYYPNGGNRKVESFENGYRHGIHASFSLANDTLGYTTFVNGSGRLTLKCGHNVQLICADSTWLHDAIDGTSIALDTSENIKTITEWKSGQKVYEKKFRNNILMVSGGFKENVRHGTWNVYYQNGTLKDRLNYENDRYFGTQLFYDSTGVLTMKRTYNGKGKKVEVELIH